MQSPEPTSDYYSVFSEIQVGLVSVGLIFHETLDSTMQGLTRKTKSASVLNAFRLFSPVIVR